MRWLVASPYFEHPKDTWLHSYVDNSEHTFQLVPRHGEDRNWHQSSAKAQPVEWLNRARQAKQSIDKNAGTITIFPQLTAAASLWKSTTKHKQPLISWFFNTEGLNSRTKRYFSRHFLKQVNLFAVHSSAEIERYAEFLQLPKNRFEFVPLQYGAPVETKKPEGVDEPYIFATGSGYRDYKTFFESIDQLGYKTFVLASERVLKGLTIPKSVTIMDQITRPEIRQFVRHARVNVVPMNDQAITAGLITIVETFRHGRSLVITERPGLEDYIFDNKNALCAKLFDPASMSEKIEAMWTDSQLREKLDRNAHSFAETNCTDYAAAKKLLEIVDRFN